MYSNYLLKKFPVYKFSNFKKKVSKLDFELYEKNGTIFQRLKKKNELFLKKNYSSKISNSIQMNESKHRLKHSKLFMQKLNSKIKNLKNKKVLDIGCGNGFLLFKLSRKGAKVVGVESSQNIKKIKGIKIYDKLEDVDNQKFDLIIHNCYLEHEFNLKRFIKTKIKFLKKDGKIFFCVPDNKRLIRDGDANLINHEHLAYFTKASLKNYFLKNSRFSLKIDNDKIGNIFCYGSLNNSIKNKNLKFSSGDLKIFSRTFDKMNKNIQLWLDKINFNKTHLILYGATAAATNLFLNKKLNKSKIFICDSDRSKQKLYIEGFPNKITQIDNVLKKKKDFKILILAKFYTKDIYQMLTKKYKIEKSKISMLSQFKK